MPMAAGAATLGDLGLPSPLSLCPQLTHTEILMGNSARLIRLLCTCLASTIVTEAGEWPTFGHDPQRTGWAVDERSLSPQTVPNLGLKWKTKVDNQGSLLFALTAPIVAVDVSTRLGIRDVVYVAGKEGKVFALDSDTGELLWEWKVRSYALPNNVGLQGSIYCPNGVSATPTFDKRTGILYTLRRGRRSLRAGHGQRQGPLWARAVCRSLREELGA